MAEPRIPIYIVRAERDSGEWDGAPEPTGRTTTFAAWCAKRDNVAIQAFQHDKYGLARQFLWDFNDLAAIAEIIGYFRVIFRGRVVAQDCVAEVRPLDINLVCSANCVNVHVDRLLDGPNSSRWRGLHARSAVVW